VLLSRAQACSRCPTIAFVSSECDDLVASTVEIGDFVRASAAAAR
jgi:hypothetical protein